MKWAYSDVVVCGGSVLGCLAAARAAKAGLRVTIVESREFLGGDFVGGNRLFVRKSELSSPLGMALTELGVISAQEIEAAVPDAEILLYEGKTKQRLLEKMQVSGVNILYLARPIGVGYRDGQLCGMTVATKYGALFLRAKHIIDAPSGICAALASGTLLCERDTAEVTVIPRVSGVTNVSVRQVDTGMDGVTAVLHPVKRKGAPNDALLELRFTIRKAEFASLAPFYCRTAGVRKAIQAICALRRSDPAFANARISYFPYEAMAEPFEPFAQKRNGITRIDDLQRENGNDWLETIRNQKEPEMPENIPLHGEMDDEMLPVTLYDAGAPDASAVLRADAALAGIGAGGGAAAVALMRRGVSFVACENKPQVGGTRVVGGVVGYWHGYPGGWNQEILREKDAFEQQYGGNLFEEGEALEDAWLSDRLLGDPNGRVLTGTVFAAAQDGARCTGFYAATDRGVFKMTANITVDATGDGDLAAFCGAEFCFGDSRDGMSQGCSMWGYAEKKGITWRDSTAKGDFTVINPMVYSDYLRGINLATVYNSPYAFTGMLTVRESRHIIGEYFLTLRDILTQRVFPDTVMVGCCPLDAHGYNDTDLDWCGFADYLKPGCHSNDSISRAVAGSEQVTPDIRARVPVGCFIPKGARGLLLCGKSLSADKDASSLVRMNPEILNAGYAIGLLAARCADGTDPRDVDLAALQTELTQAEILPDWTFAEAFPFGIDEHIARAKRKTASSVLFLCVAEVDDILPALKQAYAADPDLTIAEILAYRHCADGFNLLMRALDDAEKNARITEYAQLLVLVTRAGLSDSEKRHTALTAVYHAAAEFTAGADAVTQRGGPYAWSKEHVRVIGHNRLLLSICRCASALGDRTLAKPLMQMLSIPELYGEYAPPIHEEKTEKTWAKEYALMPNRNIFLTYARVKLLQAAADCGSREAAGRLSEYRNDPISIIRRMAEKYTG